jgi:hypothetical protein
MSDATLLSIDAALNLALGILLIVFPRGVMRTLGVPIPDTLFYPNTLGAVLIGISVSLIIERFRSVLGVAGLGLVGAIIVNLCGAGALIWWLINGGLQLPLQGYIVLWLLAIAVMSISVLEILMQFRR